MASVILNKNKEGNRGIYYQNWKSQLKEVLVRIIAGSHHHKMGLVAGGGEETTAGSKGDG